MNGYNIRIEVEEGEVARILKKLQEAQEVIGRCYDDLENLGVVHVKKNETASGN